MQNTNSKAVIVWIDDYFISEEFKNKKDKNIYWDQLFGKFSSKVYRLMDINIVIKGTRDEGIEFIKNISVMDGVYYYCILDMYLPLNQENRETEVEYSKDIAKLLLKKKIDFSFLSSASKLSGEADQALQSIDFYTKAKNQGFTLPSVLRQKILHQVKKNVHWLDINKKLINRLESTGSSDNIKSQLSKDPYSSLFPFIDGFRDFIEFSEFEEIPFHQTLFIRSSKSASDIYEMQCLLLMLTDKIFGNKKFTINYKKVTSENFVRIEEELESASESLQCFRLKDITLKQFKRINKKSTGKQRIYIVDTDDFQIEDYMNEIGAFTLKDFPTIQMSNDTLRTDILIHTLKYILNKEADALTGTPIDKSKSIYFHYPRLLIDPVDYIKFTDHSLHIKTLDDPNEIISEVFTGYEEKIKAKLSSSIINNAPMTSITELKEASYSDDNNILVKAIIFWLGHSWNMHYGIDVEAFKENYNDQIDIEKWRIESFQYLVLMSRSLRAIEEETPFKEPLEQINIILKSQLPELILHDNTSEALDFQIELLTKTKWPHKYFPVPLIAHDRLEKHGKTFWLQHNNFNNIEYSEDLKRDFKYLDQKIEYYERVLKLIESTVKFLPSNAHTIIYKIMRAIKREDELVLDATFREEFKNISNIFIRISLNFGLLIHKENLSNVGYDRDNEDKAKLGTHVSTIRDRLLKDKQDFFEIDMDSMLNADDDLLKNMHFIMKHTKLLYEQSETALYNYVTEKSGKTSTKRSLSFDFEKIMESDTMFQVSESYTASKIITDVGDTTFKKGQSVTDKELAEANEKLEEGQMPAVAIYDSPQAYLDSIYRSDNRNPISQISNLSKFLYQNDLLMQVIKHMNGVKLLSYMADTRNSWEHKTGELDKYFHHEKFFEFFIFSYESMWNKYSFLINLIDYNSEMLGIKSKYVNLRDDKTETKSLNNQARESFVSDFSSKEDFDYYLNHLEKK